MVNQWRRESEEEWDGEYEILENISYISEGGREIGFALEGDASTLQAF